MARATFSSAAHGKSLVEKMRDELDRVIDILMKEGLGADPEERGYANGLAWCIATIENCYEMDIASVKNDAMLRWEERSGQGGQVQQDRGGQRLDDGADVQSGQ